MHRLAILVGVMRDANCDKIINLAFARNYMMYFWIRMYLYWGNRLNQEGQRRVSHQDLFRRSRREIWGVTQPKDSSLGKLGKLGPARLLQTCNTQSLLCIRAAINGKDLVSSRESALHQGKEGRIYY